MERFRAKKVEHDPHSECSWVVLDTEQCKIARLRGKWLEFLAEDEAVRLAAELNGGDGAAGVAMAQ